MTGNKYRGLRINLLVSLIAAVLTCSGLEVAARWARPGLLRTEYDHRRQPADPYLNAAYYSEAFIEEAFRHPTDWYFDGSLLAPADSQGQWFNARDGRRVTTDTPDTYTHTIYLFGGSTLYSGEVPDSLTIPSHLQRQINAADYPYRAINMGVTSLSTSHQWIALQRTPLQAGDMVVWYDGVNDISTGIWAARPTFTLMVDYRLQRESLPPTERARRDVYAALSPYSALVDVLLRPVQHTAPDHLANPRTLDGLILRVQAIMRANLQHARRYTEARGARFVHVLQPHLFTMPTLSAYERSLVDNHYLVKPGLDEAFRLGYPPLREMLALQGRDGLETVDLSHVLDTARLSGHEFYFDAFHVDDEANEIVALAIFRILFGE